MRTGRIAKPLQRQLVELEHHLFILRDNLHRFSNDEAHLMVVSATLRTLICLSSGTEGLLWRMIDHVGASDEVLVDVAGSVNPDDPLNRGLSVWVLPFSRHPIHGGSPHSFKGLVKQCDAIYTLGRSFTFEQLIKSVAEQVGTAHADPGIEPRLLAIEDLHLNGRPAYGQVIATLSEFTLMLGDRVLTAAEASIGYKRQRYSDPWSLSVHVNFKEIPLAVVHFASWQPSIAEVRFDGFVSPESLIFRVQRANGPVFSVRAPRPEVCNDGRESFFSLTYDHRAKMLQAIGPRVAGSIEKCDLGHIDPTEFRPPEVDQASNPYIRINGVSVHSRIFTPDEVNRLPEVLGLPSTIS